MNIKTYNFTQDDDDYKPEKSWLEFLKRHKLKIIIIICVVLFGQMIFKTLFAQETIVTTEVVQYQDIVVEGSYEVAAESTIQDGETYNLTSGNYTVGVDVPAGVYNINKASYGYCYMASYGVDGSDYIEIIDEDKTSCAVNSVTLHDGESFVIKGATLSFSAQKEVSTPAKTITTSMTTTVDPVTGDILYQSCTYTDSTDETQAIIDIECSELENHQIMIEDTQSINNKTVTTEEVITDGRNTTCTIDGVVVDCANLSTY